MTFGISLYPSDGGRRDAVEERRHCHVSARERDDDYHIPADMTASATERLALRTTAACARAHESLHSQP